jgi:hypothetical protein
MSKDRITGFRDGSGPLGCAVEAASSETRANRPKRVIETCDDIIQAVEN